MIESRIQNYWHASLENIDTVIQKKKSKYAQKLQNTDSLREFKKYNNKHSIMDCRHIKYFQQTLLPWIKLRMKSNESNKTRKPLTRLQKKKKISSTKTSSSSSSSSSCILPQERKHAIQFITQHMSIIKYNLIMDQYFSELQINEYNKIMNSIFQTVWSLGTQVRGIKSLAYIISTFCVVLCCVVLLYNNNNNNNK